MRKIRIILALLLAMSLLTGMGTTAFANEETNSASQSETVDEATSAIIGETGESLASENPVEQPQESGVDDVTSDDSSAEENGQPDTEANASETGDALTDEAHESETGEEPMQTPSEDEGSVQSDTAEDDGDEIAAHTASPTAAAASPTYKISISWTGMSFTYHAKSGGQWNTDGDRIGYSEETPAYWSSSDGGKRYGTITIKAENLTPSDGSITATLNFAQDSAFSSGQLAMRFSTSSSDVGSVDPMPLQLALNSSISEVTVYAVPCVGGDMKPFSNDTKLGTVTLTIAAGGGSPWTDPAVPELPEAFN